MRRQRRSSAGRGGPGGHRPTHRARHIHLCQPQPPLLLLLILLVLVLVVAPMLVLVLLVLVLLLSLWICSGFLQLAAVVRQYSADDTSLVGLRRRGLGMSTAVGSSASPLSTPPAFCCPKPPELSRGCLRLSLSLCGVAAVGWYLLSGGRSPKSRWKAAGAAVRIAS